MKKIAVVMFGIAALVGCARVFVTGQETESNPTSLQGVWQTVVTPRDCATGNPFGISFPGILLFAGDGTVTGTSTAVSSVFGLWSRQPGLGQFSFSTISQRYNASGVLVGTRRIYQSVTLSDKGNYINTEGGFEDHDLSGTIVLSGCSTATGTRFEQ